MPEYKYLDKTGLTTFKSKIDVTYAKKNDVYTKSEVDAAIADASIPTVVVTASQVISQNPFTVQLTQEQWNVFAHNYQVIINGSALGVGSNLFYKGTWDSDNGYYFASKVYSRNLDHYDIVFEFDETAPTATMEFHTATDSDLDPSHVGTGDSSDTGKILKMDSSGWGVLSNGLPYIDCTGASPTYPSSANTDGLTIVLCASEPTQRYAGYLYIITGSN